MNSEIKLILDDVKRGELSVDDAALKIKVKPFEDIGYAKVDLHRKVRQGAAEVIYGAEKNRRADQRHCFCHEGQWAGGHSYYPAFA